MSRKGAMIVLLGSFIGWGNLSQAAMPVAVPENIVINTQQPVNDLKALEQKVEQQAEKIQFEIKCKIKRLLKDEQRQPLLSPTSDSQISQLTAIECDELLLPEKVVSEWQP